MPSKTFVARCFSGNREQLLEELLKAPDRQSPFAVIASTALARTWLRSRLIDEFGAPNSSGRYCETRGGSEFEWLVLGGSDVVPGDVASCAVETSAIGVGRLGDARAKLPNPIMLASVDWAFDGALRISVARAPPSRFRRVLRWGVAAFFALFVISIAWELMIAR